VFAPLSGATEHLTFFRYHRVYPLLFNAKAMKNVRPAIIHGDLWSGNAGTDEQTGQPIIFDPSSSHSHNEAELGIMKMFGGFNKDFFEAYHQVIPKAEPYYQERQDMYEAYHHLNHFVMFGGGYRSGTVRIFKKLIAWAEREGSRAIDGGDESGESGGGGGGGTNNSSSSTSRAIGLRGGNSNLQSAPLAMTGCSTSSSYQTSYDYPPPGGAGAATAVASTSANTLDASAPLHQGIFPPATPSQIADYFSQMICYLWFSSGVPGHSMPSTPSRSPTSKHAPLQSSPLAPRRMPAASFAGPSSGRSFRPTHAKTSSTGSLYQAGLPATALSPDLSRPVQDEIYASTAATTSRMIANDPMLRRLQPKSRFLRFSREVLSTTQVSTSVITLALIYVHRLKAAHPHLKGREGSEFRLAISSLMLANKILDDNTYLNKTWAEISGMPLIEISKMEVEFWLGLKMELHINKEDYDRGLNEIQMLANDRNRAVLQRDAAVKRAIQQQQQALAQTSQYTPYMQPGLSVSSDGLAGPYDSRFTSPLQQFSAQPAVRRSMGHFDALGSHGHSYLDSTIQQPLPYQMANPSYDFASTMQDYSVQTPPYFARPSTFTLPPSPLSQASAGNPITQQDGFRSGSLMHDTLASSPTHRASLPYSFPNDQWSAWNQNSTGSADAVLQNSSRSYEVSPTNTSLAPPESYPWQRRPSLSTQSTSTLAGLKRDFEKTYLDTNSPVGGPQPSSKRFAVDPSITEDLQHYRLSSKQPSQSPTETRYSLRSRTRGGAAAATASAAMANGRAQGNVGRVDASAASPIYPAAMSAQPSPVSQRSFQLPRPIPPPHDTAFHQPHPNYHSVFTSAMTPNSLAAPLDNRSMDLHQPRNGSQAGLKKIAPLQYYSLAAGEPFGNIGSYLPPPSNARGHYDAIRRLSMRSDSSQKSGPDAWDQGIHPQTPLSAPSFASGYTVQAKDDNASTSVQGVPPFSLDVNAWPMTSTASSNFLVPYHLLPSSHHHTTRPHVT
jgi:hypothetical protein